MGYRWFMLKVVVGLGNPGRQYEGTRHNIGFSVIDCFVTSSGTAFQEKMGGLIAELRFGLDKVLLVKPQTFMNSSGRCVTEVMQFYKVPLDNLLVVCDDLNLPIGKIRIRAKGSHGGNNGLRDIQSYVGEQYSRLKMGVGNPRQGDATSHVLGKFSSSERSVIADSIILAGQAVQVWLNSGINVVMNQFNSGSDGKD